MNVAISHWPIRRAIVSDHVLFARAAWSQLVKVSQWRKIGSPTRLTLGQTAVRNRRWTYRTRHSIAVAFVNDKSTWPNFVLIKIYLKRVSTDSRLIACKSVTVHWHTHIKAFLSSTVIFTLLLYTMLIRFQGFFCFFSVKFQDLHLLAIYLSRTLPHCYRPRQCEAIGNPVSLINGC